MTASKTKPHIDGSTAPLRRLSRDYLLTQGGRLTIAIGCMMIMAACTTLFAHFIQPLFDEGFIGKNIQVIMVVPAVLLVVTIIKSAATFFQGYQLEFIGLSMVARLQQELYDRMIRQTLSFYHVHPPAELTNRFMFDLQRLHQAIAKLVGGGLRDTTVIIGLSVNLFWKDWLLALASLVVIPLAALPILRFGKILRKYSYRMQEQAAGLAHQLTETFGFVRQVQADHAENRESKRASVHIHDVFTTTLRAARARSASSPVLEIIATLAIVLVIYFGLYRAYTGVISTGQFASFLASLLLLVRPIKGMTNLNNFLQEALAAASRTFELIDAPINLTDAPNAKPLVMKKGEISFNKIDFHYADGTQVFDTFSLDIKAGQSVALVGASGSGKSTLINLITRFYDPTSGAITIDGQDIKQATLESLRSNIALVSQEIAIFDDTVSANIAYARPDATPEQIKAAAKAAQADVFIDELPQGYDTVLGPAGVRLSGGQRQRLAIARAILKDAPILLLDEATASLDSEAEREVQAALETLMKGRTSLVVAHRLSTVVNCDQIYVLNKGNIIEHGTHKDLLKKGGKYADLWRLQQGDMA